MKNNHALDIFQLLRNKKSEMIMNELKSFVNTKFEELRLGNSKIEAIANEYQDFLFKVTLSFSKLWSIDFECNRSIYCSISDSFDSLMSKVLNRNIFQLITDYMKANDSKLKFDDLINKYSFITLQHLGVNIPIDHFNLSEEIKSFVDICQLKSTVEKSQCIRNLCNYFTASYPKISLVLLLTYTLISSSIPQIYENILFIKLFRNKTSITPIEDYYLEQMTSAIELICNLDNNNSFLTINQFQFENYCFEYEKKQLTPFLTDKSINEIDDKESNQNPKVDSSIVNLMNKIFFIGTSKGNRGMNNHNSNKMKEKESLLSIPITQLQNDYCVMEFKEMNYAKIEQLYKDFKILLKIIESYKKEI